MRPDPRMEQFGLFPGLHRLRGSSPVAPAEPDPIIHRLARQLPSLLRMGTSSWTFAGWKGLVYEGRLDQKRLANQGLQAYSAYPLFRTVGVDRTFYRPMTEEQLAIFAGQVPDGFRFVVKASRAVTSLHDADREGNPIGPNPRFLDAAWAAEAVIGPTMAGLAEKCGIILFQFSPMRLDRSYTPQRIAEWMGRFLEALPRGPAYAVEIRNRELLTRDYAAMLNARGAIHAFNVHPTMPSLERQEEVVGADSGPATLCRWLLHGLGYEEAGGRYEPFSEIVDEDPARRRQVAALASRSLLTGRPTYIIADNKAEGSAPRTLAKLAKVILGRIVGAP